MVASTKKTIQTDGTSDTTTTITSTITASKMNSLITNICSMSFGSTMFMALFTIFSFMNIYRMMYPLSAYDLSKFGDETNFVKPLWDTASEMHIRGTILMMFVLSFCFHHDCRFVILWRQRSFYFFVYITYSVLINLRTPFLLFFDCSRMSCHNLLLIIHARTTSTTTWIIHFR